MARDARRHFLKTRSQAFLLLYILQIFFESKQKNFWVGQLRLVQAGKEVKMVADPVPVLKSKGSGSKRRIRHFWVCQINQTLLGQAPPA